MQDTRRMHKGIVSENYEICIHEDALSLLVEVGDERDNGRSTSSSMTLEDSREYEDRSVDRSGYRLARREKQDNKRTIITDDF